MPSGTEFISRLREEAHRTLSPQIKALEDEFRDLENTVSASLAQIARKLDSLRNTELPTSGLVLQEAFATLSRKAEAECGVLSDFAVNLRGKETQEEILDCLLDQCRQFTPRIALFALREDRGVGWSSRGFSEELARRISLCSFSLHDSSSFTEAATKGTAEDINPAQDPKIEELTTPESAGLWHVFALRAMDRTVAFLMTSDPAGRLNRAAVRLMVEMTALYIENVALRILRDLEAPALNEPAPAQPAEPISPVESPGSEASVLSEFKELFARAQEVVAPGREQPIAAPETIKAEAALSAVGAQEAEPLRESRPEDSGEPKLSMLQGTAAQQPAVAKENQRSEEEKLHADAKRFARLLVSEIKLYNEQRVLEGRENRDVYVRLKRDIDRSREMYERRVAPSVSRKIDYFHDEVIRILGDNDLSTLGSDYPGPRVES